MRDSKQSKRDNLIDLTRAHELQIRQSIYIMDYLRESEKMIIKNFQFKPREGKKNWP